MAQDDQAALTSARLRVLLEEMLAIPSPTGEEMGIIGWLRERFRELGFDCQLEPVDQDQGRGQGQGRCNLIALRGRPAYLIATHADTVPAWGHPHADQPKVEGERVYGRGAVDTKGQLAALLVALERTAVTVPAAVAVFVDEEERALGSKRFSPPGHIAGAVVLEPTELKLAIAQAGSLELQLEVRGKAAHGALPGAGVNAIERFFQVYQELKQLPFMRARHPLLPPPAVTVGKVEGGISPQVVPDRCSAEVEAIILPGTDFERACQDLIAVLERHEVAYQVIDRDPPWELSPEEPVVQLLARAAREAGLEPRYGGMPAWTDASYLLEKGLPVVVFGAGKLELAHTPWEYAELAELARLAAVLERFLTLVASAGESP